MVFSRSVIPRRSAPVCRGGRVREERPDHDEVVQDRGEHRRREPPVRLEESDDDRADAVEDDLWHEPSEEEDAELDLGFAVGRVRGNEVQTDDLLREQRTERSGDTRITATSEIARSATSRASSSPWVSMPLAKTGTKTDVRIPPRISS